MVQAALDADDRRRRERRQAKHARKLFKRFRAVILTAQKDRRAEPLAQALASFKTNCAHLHGARPLITQAEALLRELAEERAEMVARKKAMSALKRAIRAAEASRDPEPLRATLQKVTPQYVHPGHPLVATAKRLLQDLEDEKRQAAALAALQAAIVEARRTRAVMPLKYALKACLDQYVRHDDPVVDEARKLLQLLQDEENARLLAESKLLKAIGVGKRALAQDNPNTESLSQAKNQLVEAKITALNVCVRRERERERERTQ